MVLKPKRIDAIGPEKLGVSLAASMLEQTSVYRAWQLPFANQKFAPVLAHNRLPSVRRVLDVACGPGTNTGHFANADYLGIDFNEHYIRDARRRFRRNFEVADARSYAARSSDRFDFILVNSFLHHLDTNDVRAVLLNLRSMLTPDGHIHILEPEMPERPLIAHLLARWDRGKFVRPFEKWVEIFDDLFERVVFEPYRLTGMGFTLWRMLYFKGRARA
jgi:SAM-dependent methyltransferase